jgi:hypothetical protein
MCGAAGRVRPDGTGWETTSYPFIMQPELNLGQWLTSQVTCETGSMQPGVGAGCEAIAGLRVGVRGFRTGWWQSWH